VVDLEMLQGSGALPRRKSDSDAPSKRESISFLLLRIA
jgi:hypothetical protein